tara:strand:+ start:35 stop:952 length:918 start_codon:yes stop_codon:yes gene_type:complete
MERGFKGIWIPKDLWLTRELNAQEKCLVAEIDSLDCSEKHCYASDDYLMEFIGCSRPTLQRMLKKLKDLGYITVVSFDGRKRSMVSNLKTIFKKENDDVSKMRQQDSQKRDSTCLKNEVHITKEREKDKEQTNPTPTDNEKNDQQEKELKELVGSLRDEILKKTSLTNLVRLSFIKENKDLSDQSFSDCVHAYLEYAQANQIDDPIATLTSAFKKLWKPKIDRKANAEKKDKAEQNIIDKNFQYGYWLNSLSLEFGFSSQCHHDHLQIKIPKWSQYAILKYKEPDFLEKFKNVIDEIGLTLPNLG